ncbi:hypothetical protein B0T10DRAFT_450059 [Thelonectria olida]|uniref:PD-(D/E)XK nuclease-like domain-containing protein n=1 Tax=Thelonectria olida TaxID=1576542 RepID=A0A9P8VRA1_9HYPO|nr:hypothetical protein B0T10DRAFT_450059 [Thelonectria olida]
MSQDRINLWLESVILELESDFSSAEAGWDKPKQATLPSPPASLKRPMSSGKHADMTSTPIKKRRLDEEGADVERTPRQGDSVSITGSDIPSLPSRPSSVASGQVSPSRLVDQLRHEPNGVLIRTMDVNDEEMPGSLRDFIPSIEMIATGFQIVPAHLETEISRLAPSRQSLKHFFPHFYAPAASQSDSEQASKTDTSILTDIFRIVDKAKECLNRGQDEAGWNNLVHTPVLEMALYGRDAWGKQLAGFCPCMSAGIIPRYRIDNVAGKKIDYALFIDPTHDADATSQIEALYEGQGSVNHTNFAPLQKCPVTVSIETKRPDESQQRANIQMGIWQAAQWRALEQLAGSTALKSLEFLPGVLVIGHQWNFVATSYKNGRTTLWTERSIGSTQTEFGAFQIMAGIFKLRKWSLDVFWPWYKLHVLKIEAEVEQRDEVEVDIQGLAVNESINV